MRNFRPFADLAVFDLDEFSGKRIPQKMRAVPQETEGPHFHVFFRDDILGDHIAETLHVALQYAATEDRSRTEAAARADLAASPDLDVRGKERFTVEHNPRRDPYRARVNAFYPFEHPLREQAVPHFQRKRGKLERIVHAGEILGAKLHRNDVQAATAGPGNEIDNVIFPLTVVLRQAGKALKKHGGSEQVDAGVYFGYAQLLRRRVLCLHDTDAAPAPDDAPVGSRLVQIAGHERRVRRVRLVKKGADLLLGDHRHVAVHDQNALPLSDPIGSGHDRVSGAKLLFLPDHFGVGGILREPCLDVLPSVSDHNGDVVDAGGSQRS